MAHKNRRTLKIEALESRKLLATLVVSSPSDSGPGSLRQAIVDSNQLVGRDEITFELPSDGLQILPEFPLPALTDSVTIDGTTQSDYTDAPVIGLFGWRLDGVASGLSVEAHDVTIRGLAIEGFSHAGIFVNESGGTAIESSYVGLAEGNGIGIHLYNSSGATIGGTNAGNVISGNDNVGILISGPSATNNRIQGNLIGTDLNGNQSVPNNVGILIDAGAHRNIIGVDVETETNLLHRNVISGNSIRGIEINGSSENTVAGNLIGPAADGRTRLPSQRVGVFIINNSSGNIVGGSSPEESNVISGNSRHGVFIRRSLDNRVSGNLIGTTADGLSELANTQNGVWVTFASGNIIGTNGDGVRDEYEGNLISANGCGVYFGNTFKNWIAGNLIGTDISGTVALPNSIGTHLAVDSTQNVIGTNGDGTSDPLERNIISGNHRNAIELNNARENRVAGNWLGLGTDESIVANGHSGIWIHNNATQNIIGGRTAAHRNVISGNLFEGVSISANHNQVHGNYIGTSPDGLSPAGNRRQNIYLYSGAVGNVIGGQGPEWRNVIAAAGIDGIFLDDTPLTVILGNWIGLGADGETLLGNERDGIGIHGGTILVNIGGRTPGAGNVIAGNHRHGIGALWMWDSFITGNKFGETATGAPVSNGDTAIRLDSSTGVLIGDGTEEGANSITSIGSPAISIVGDSQSVYVQRSEIRTDSIPVDLAEDGPSPNDPNDFDFGPNRMQNYRPVLAVSNNPLYSVVTAGPIDALTTPYYDYVYAVRTNEAGLSSYRYLGEFENLLGNGPDTGWIYSIPPLEEGERITLISYDEINGSSEFSPPVSATLNLLVSLHGGEQYDEGETITGEIARGTVPLDMPVSVRLLSGDFRLGPINVTIPAGEIAAQFAIQIENDQRSQATKSLVLLAAADDIGATGSAPITIRRSDTWYNDLMPLDTTGDGNIAPNDVLAIINQLNAEGAGRLPTDNDSDLFVDVNADQHLSPIDALQIINFLNSARAGESEHTAPADEALSSHLREPDESLHALWDWLERERKDRHAHDPR